MSSPFDKTLELIVSGYEVSSGDNLKGMDYDVSYFMSESNRLVYMTHEVTEDPRCLIAITMETGQACETILDVKNGLFDCFSKIKYDYYSSSEIICNDEKLLFRFVTVVSSGDFFVSGRILVRGKRYETIYRKHYESWPN
jgi:hypothetical protein